MATTPIPQNDESCTLGDFTSLHHELLHNEFLNALQSESVISLSDFRIFIAHLDCQEELKMDSSSI